LCSSRRQRRYARPPEQISAAGLELQLFCAVVWLINQSPGAAMNNAEQPSPEEYRQLAEKLRELADQSHLPDIQGDLRVLAAQAGSTILELKTFLDSSRLGAARFAGRINS
jgi:hypothetical protein